MNTYLICYAVGEHADAFEVYGYRSLCEHMKWLHSIKATDISIYKHGKDFESDSDDIIECHKKWWK